MSRHTLAVLAASIALALPGMASAGSNDFDVIVDGRTGNETRTLAVSLNDLNLADTHDYRRADSRVVRAAKQVCGYVGGSIMPVTNDYRSCYGDALGGARTDLDTLAAAQRAG